MKTNLMLSFETEEVLKRIGLALKIARKRRGETVLQACERIGISRSNYVRLESGDAGVGVGAFFEALIVYGFGEKVFDLSDPDNDKEGKSLSIRSVLKNKK